MNYQNSRKGQRGQALILIALAAVGLFAFSALAIDGSRAFSNKRHAQNTADTSVLAAALAKARGNDYEAAASARAASNGFTHDTNPMTQPNVKVYIHLCSAENTIDPETGWLIPPCDGLPSGAVKSEYIRVRIVSTIPTTFGRVIGRSTLTSAAEAIARVQSSTTPSSGGFSSGAGLLAINDSASETCLLLNSGAHLHTHNTGISINCSGDATIYMNTGIEFRMDAMGEVVGCYMPSSGIRDDPAYDHDPIDCDVNGGTSVTYDASDFADVPTMPAAPTCDGTAYLSGNKLYPGSTTRGTYPGQLTVGSSIEITAGTYCFPSGININGGGSISGTGDVKIVTGGDILWQVGGPFNFNEDGDSLEIYSTNSNFTISRTLNAKRLRFYSSGSGNFTIESGGTVNAENAYIYLKAGNINWLSGSNVNMHAPPQDDPFGVGGLLVHKPFGNRSLITLNGNSNSVLYGTFMVPTSSVTLNGSTSFELHSQIIAWSYIINTAEGHIWYDASENYNPPAGSDPTIELTK